MQDRKTFAYLFDLLLPADLLQDQLDSEFIEEEDENKAAPVYRDLIAIHATKLKGRIESHWQDLQQNKVTRLSMSEQQLEKAIRTHKEEIIKYSIYLSFSKDYFNSSLTLTYIRSIKI